MPHYRAISVAVAMSVGVTGCASNDFGGISTTTLIGCGVGAGLGGLVGYWIGDSGGALLGAGLGTAVGCTAGFFWKLHEEKLEKLAAQEAVDIEFEQVGSIAAEQDTSQQEFVVVQSKKIVQAEQDNDIESIKKVVGTAENVGLSATVKGDIFSSGKTNITSVKHKRFFEKYADVVKNKKQAILIIGHTDSQGSAETNAKISIQRAYSVAQALISQGVEKEYIYIYGAGESQPIASNLSKDGRAENRRIEIVSFANKPEFVTGFVRYKESEPAFAKLRSHDNLLSKSKKISKVASNNHDIKMIQETVKKEVNNKNKRSVRSRTFVDFGGNLYQGHDDNLFAHIGDRSDNRFSLIGQAVASSVEVSSCIYDEPQITTKVVSLAKDELHTTDYLPGMNRTAWWGKVENHGVAISPVAVSKHSLSITEPPVIFVYENYKNGQKNKPFKTKKSVNVNIYNGSKGVIYRAFIKDKNYPIQCLDIAIDKVSKNGSFNTFDGKVYYKGPKGLMIADYKPGKA